MRIGLNLLTQSFIPVFGAPDGRPIDEESLWLCKTVNQTNILVFECHHERFIGHIDPTQVSNILTQGKFTVYCQIIKRLVMVIPVSYTHLTLPTIYSV